ncbi:cytochrome c biogenesis CcdA family protein [Actinomyces mediterranea]|uniref:cytochrome c biogenesis CcdA family protein n=1 Tax=Actinomyces mediterranea TaxID=1871028 RepID=UPI0009711154|nr:cytochrome c biogenesis CcdA family protein [Actinomyces mediterranea]
MTLAPLAALLGGALTLFAPCSVMLLPAFFAYAFASRTTLAARTLLFWAGLVTALVPLGVLAGTAGAVLSSHTDLLTRAAAALIMILGIVQVFAVELPRPRLVRRPAPSTRGDERDSAHPLSVFLLGTTYGFAGAGCAGPILGAVLVTAGLGGSPVTAGGLMVLYATGMALPLGLLALVWRGLSISERSWLRPRPLRLLGRDTTWTNVLSGSLFVILGMLLLVAGASNPLGSLIGAERLASWEESIMRVSSIVPWWALLAAVVCIGVAVFFILPRSGRR